MYSIFTQRLNTLLDAHDAAVLKGGLIGLEKETLRVAEDGSIAQTPHPPALGCALSHPWITTDYSEALLEFITPPFAQATAALDFLHALHSFTYPRLQQELLWSTSMPCVLKGEASIPVAYYGSSHAGRMKTIYRLGLGHRYGRIMQVISGIHFNYSPPESFWQGLHGVVAAPMSMRAFKDHYYFAMLRNLQRLGWLIPYLFGTSPAVCKSFLAGKPTTLAEFDEGTYYEPYATSLRMGDIGYQNRKEEETGIKACYDDLERYIACLSRAISTPCPEYERIGVIRNGAYQQLNTHILQIENEYYSSVRPKAIPQGNERPTKALHREGVRYVELRSLDVNVFEPLGIGLAELYFLEAFLLFCVLYDSPLINPLERLQIDHNQSASAHRGRDPALLLLRGDTQIPLRTWASEVLAAMAPLCAALDTGQPAPCYQPALQAQQHKVDQPEHTPSARLLAAMAEQEMGFHEYAWQLSAQHQQYFQQQAIAHETLARLTQEVDASCERQQAMEASSTGCFEDYLAAYFAG